MSISFKAHRSLKRSVRKIAHRLIDQSTDRLAVTSPSERDEAIHDARKALKKLRSLLRLIRPAISRSDYQAANQCFRDAGLPLTRLRDLKVLIESFDVVARECFPEDVPESIQEVRRSITEQLYREHDQLSRDQTLAAMVARLMVARDDVRDWSQVPNRWRSLGRGLKATFCRVLKAQRKADLSPSPESYHEWRKQVRYLRYQVDLLRSLDPDRLIPFGDAVDRVSKGLGLARDLTSLENFLSSQSGAVGDPVMFSRFAFVLHRRRADALAMARRLAAEVFRHPPGNFVGDLKVQWKASRKVITAEET